MSDKFLQDQNDVRVVPGDVVDWRLETWKTANNMTAARKGYSESQVDNLRRGIKSRYADFSPYDIENTVTTLLKDVEYGQ